MGYACDFCGEQRAVVYCRSDSASLCLSCDHNVHSANALSKRHSRTLVCERCNAQPSFVRCVEERISLCQNCDWTGHGDSNSASMHKRQIVKFYSGCPSVAELSTIWSFFLDSPSPRDICEQGMGSMAINDNCEGNFRSPLSKNSQNMTISLEASDSQNVDNLTALVGSSIPQFDVKLQNGNQPARSTTSTIPKISLSGITEPSMYEDDAFYENFIVDDIDLKIEDYEELFGAGLSYEELFFENDEIDNLFGMKGISADDSNCQEAHTVEGSSSGLVSKLQPTCSTAGSTHTIINRKAESNICFARKANSSLSFLGPTGESNAGDYQDCGAASIVLKGEPPWYPPCPESSFTSASRSDAVMRYKEKKKTRKFEKKVRYVSRKARADVRKRVKGRFVKVGDAYDYDPMNQTGTH